MSASDDFSFSSEEFSGTARLFPLPNLVLFPHVMQPLHIFEPRYRELLEDALAHDRLIAMALLRPGWEEDYYGRPPLHRVACLGRVVLHHRLEGGSYNVLLVGLRRVRLVRELPPTKGYREAAVEICEDLYPAQDAAATARLQRRLHDAFLSVAANIPQAQEQLDQLLSSEIPLGTLTDVISYVLDISLDEKQRYLAEPDVHLRADMLLSHLSEAASDSRVGDGGNLGFPPEFSSN
jgi:Lon protease-like protein